MPKTQKTPRAVRLTEDSLETITKLKFDLPPHPDHLLDAVLLPVDYYFVTDWPGGPVMRHGAVEIVQTPISWALVPDFMLEQRFTFPSPPKKNRLISIVPKETS
jgi:hypothetical protein